MSEEERRELIARQHRALYGDNSGLYTSNNPTSSQDARVNTSVTGRGPSPLAYDPFGMQPPAQNVQSEGAVQMPARGSDSNKDAVAGPGAASSSQQQQHEARANSNSSPSSNPNNNPPTFNLFDNSQQAMANRTSNSSPGGSPPRQGGGKPSNHIAGVAPIGTRPANQGQQQAGGPLNRRSTTPLPSPLSYSYNASEQKNNGNNSNDRSTSNNSSNNASGNAADKGVKLGWGSNSGVWGPAKNTLGVQASVWG